MEIVKGKHLKEFIAQKYPMVPRGKFDIIKAGPHTWLYGITPDIEIKRVQVWLGILDSVNSVAPAKRQLEKNIHNAMIKLGLIPKDSKNE